MTMTKVKIKDGLKDLDIIENNFENVKVTKNTITFGKKINGLQIFELCVDYSTFYNYALIHLYSREKKDKNTTFRNKIIEMNAKTSALLSKKDLDTVNERMIKMVMTDENIKKLKQIEKTIDDKNNCSKNETDTVDAALITLQFERKMELLKDAIHRAISGIDNVPTFMVYDDREEIGIANNFKDIVVVVDNAFKSETDKTFYEFTGIDLYACRYEILKRMFMKVRVDRCNGYIYILK